jgi:membrane peptidoglycan carboxypeptidase
MNENRFWAATLELRNTKGGVRRPAAVKTGTADNNMDFGAYGYLAAPRDPEAVALAVGIWMGNSDHSAPRTAAPPTSLAASGELWHAFVRDVSRKWPVARFERPKRIVEARIDRWSGGRPGPWTRSTVSDFFIAGTQPGAKGEIDPAGLLYSRGCGGWMVDPVQAELGPARWDDDVAAWVNRARSGGAGEAGPYGSTTAYWFGEGSWGGPLVGKCPEPRNDRDDKGRGNDKPKPPKPDEPPPPPDEDDGDGGGNGIAPFAGLTGALLPLLPLVPSSSIRRPIRRLTVRPAAGARVRHGPSDTDRLTRAV